MTQSKNLLIAITGGIGSGKSMLSNILKEKGYTVYSADEVYAELLKCPNFVNKVSEIVGVLPSGETLDRKAVASVVFSNPEKLKALNEFTHEKVMEKLLSLSRGKGVVFNEVPLLFESGYESLYDKVIVVIRPLELRVKSVVERDGLCEEEVYKRIKNQFNYENLEKDKHTVIINDSDILSFKNKVETVINEIL